jgi:hypothetical protein
MVSLLETQLEGRRISCFNVGGELRQGLLLLTATERAVD